MQTKRHEPDGVRFGTPSGERTTTALSNAQVGHPLAGRDMGDSEYAPRDSS